MPIKDSENLSLAIEKLVKSKELRVKMGKESFKIAMKYFSSELINSQTLEIYNELYF